MPLSPAVTQCPPSWEAGVGQGQRWAREGRLEGLPGLLQRRDCRAGAKKGNGRKRAELMPPWRPPRLMPLGDSLPLCLGVN